MSLSALFFLRYFRKHNADKGISSFRVEILSSLRLTNRDVFFAVHCGNEIIAFVLSPSGASLMGRWKYEDFELEKNNNNN